MLCGHLHRHIKNEPNAQVKFPVLANGNEAVVKGKITKNEMTLDIIGLDGKLVDRIQIKK